ncbi:MAG: hypothetical protein GC161_18455 [Planctomycetaceae bacterium]|nr:hypothetical protein [Planctomycetaceae bacterium]
MNGLLHLRLVAALVLAALVLAVTPSCRGPAGGINPHALTPTLPKILDRHDMYVMADPTLDELSKETYLASAAKMRAVLAAALKASVAAAGPLLPAAPVAPVDPPKAAGTGVR